MAKRFLTIVAVVLLVLCGSDYRAVTAPQPAGARDIELAEGWKLTSADGLGATGSTISAAAYDDSAWVPITRMPGTVLGILQEADVYPNLYYGMNLLTEVP